MGGAVQPTQQGGSGIFGGAAGTPPTDTARGLPMVGGFGTAPQAITPQAAPIQPRTVGVGPPPEMMRQPMPQFMMTPARQLQNVGLQALMANMMAQYGRVPGALAMTQQRPQMQTYRAPALAYRPNMAPAQTSLGRVAVSVAEQQRRAAQAELDKLKAEQSAGQTNILTGESSGG